MRAFGRWALAAVVLVVSGGPLSGQTYEVLHTFTGQNGDGAGPRGTLVRVGNDLYGTTGLGGDTVGLCAAGCGTIFKVDSGGDVSTVYAFDGNSGEDGILPAAGLTLATDGNLYGTTPSGGALGDGVVYRFDPSTNSASTLHAFDRDTGGWYAVTPAIEGTDGNLYVVTTNGHCGDDTQACATLVRMSKSGTGVVTLHTFTPDDDGAQPLSPLLQTSGTDFYGTTSLGPNGAGRVFHMNGSGNVTLVHEFTDAEGRLPMGALLQASDGHLYGVATSGGAHFAGSVYRVESDGQLTVLHSFDGADGSLPGSGLIQASDGLLYGSTESGGDFGFGTLYRMDLAGNVVVLHHFDGTSHGPAGLPSGPAGSFQPTAGLVEGADGALYGVRLTGGDSGHGIVYRYTPLPPAPLYCPNAFVRRDQMAVFLLKTEHGASHVPPACAGVFGDVACPGLFADWIEELASEGITGGCGAGSYCPLSPVTRGQMAVFLLKTEHGPSHTPPACSGVFADVPCGSQFSDWIEELAAEGITGGCGGGNFCPGNPVTRAQMAVFLLKIEHGPAYAPPACTPFFGDVLCPSLFADWIEQFYAEGITAGCR
ncbi:MAG TPA: choice-of-anchor tandem repeat GloVer-containing protein [Thermoanaerobaculia bacterium]|nr:choice-of-anchor tandem repeat GloVer-containing protein [Thermoanaerobaculia bacterium]